MVEQSLGLCAVGIGVLTGKISGRLEVPIALVAGTIGLVVLGFLPDSFADPVVLLVSALPFLVFFVTGATLVFFARRTYLR